MNNFYTASHQAPAVCYGIFAYEHCARSFKTFERRFNNKFIHNRATDYGVLGAAMGATLSKDRFEGALSGATGAIMAEIITDATMDDAKTIRAKIDRDAEVRGVTLTDKERDQAYWRVVQNKSDWGRMTAAVTALATGQDVNIAIATAGNAVENNFKQEHMRILMADGAMNEAEARKIAEELDEALQQHPELRAAAQGMTKAAQELDDIIKNGITSVPLSKRYEIYKTINQGYQLYQDFAYDNPEFMRALESTLYYGALLVRVSAYAAAATAGGPAGVAALYITEQAAMAAFDQALPYIHKGINVIAEDAREQARTAAEGEAFAQSVHGAAKGLGIVAATLAGGKALSVMGKGQLGVTLNNTTQSILRRQTAAPTTTAPTTTAQTTRSLHQGAKTQGTSQPGGAKIQGAIDLSVSTSAPSAKPGPRKAVQFNDQVEVQKFVQENKLLPNEGKVGTYGELKRIEKKGDNLTPHHMPQDAYMKQYSVTNKDGIAMMMEHNVPGIGGRHRDTRTYGKKPILGAEPRQELAADIKDVSQIYKKDGLYTPEIKDALKEVINKNKESFPELFKKK